MPIYADRTTNRIAAAIMNGVLILSLFAGVFALSPAVVLAHDSQDSGTEYHHEHGGNGGNSHGDNGEKKGHCKHHGESQHGGDCTDGKVPPPSEPIKGSITVCKIIADTDGKVSDGSDYDVSSFTVAGVFVTGQGNYLVPTTNFNTPLAFTTDLLEGDGKKDTWCVTYDNLPLGHYFYGQEQVSGTGWLAPKYNDQFTTAVEDIYDFYAYSGELFDTDTANDGNRNQNADGDITLSAERPHRTLVILNTHETLICPPPVPTSCFLPDTKGITGSIEVKDPTAQWEIGKTLASIFASAGIQADVQTDQKNYQSWKSGTTSVTVSVESTFLNEYAGYTNTFGYYVGGDLSTFKPLFREGTSTIYAAVPELASGQKVTFTLGTTTEFAFAIKTEAKNGPTYTWATENAKNTVGEQHAVTYDAGASIYAIAFEDLPLGSSDKDYNDLVVKVAVGDCTAVPTPVPNQPPVITLQGQNPMSVMVGTSYEEQGATVNDPEEGNISNKLVITGSVATSTIGTYTIFYNAKDSQGLAAQQVTRTVNVVSAPLKPVCSDGLDNDNDGKIDSADPACHIDGDPTKPYDPNGPSENERPAITLKGQNPITVTQHVSFMDPGATAFDPEDKDITGKLEVSGPFLNNGTTTLNTSMTGTFTIRYNVKDSQGLAAQEVTRTVTIVAPTTQFPGTIRICKMYTLDGSGVPTTTASGLPNGTFTMTLTDGTTTRTATFSASSFVPNAKNILNTNDSECDTFTNLPFGTYTYSQEQIGGTATSSWKAPKYNDENTVNGIGNFFVFDANNAASDGRVVLNSLDTTRTIVILNTFKAADQTPPPCTVNCGGTPPPTCTVNCGGSGGGPLPPALVITNEAVVRISDTEARVTWNTNIPATSHVVYDTTSHVAVLGPANYGYAYTTDTTATTTTTHSMIVSGLSLKEKTHFFMPASYAPVGLFAVGKELILTPTTPACTVNCGGTPVTPITPTTCPWYLNEFIHVGWKNNPSEVKKLQFFLRIFEKELGLEVNGVYDTATVNAVNRFQVKYFNDVLKPWGHTTYTSFVYITTRQKVNEIYCNTEYPFTADQLREIEQFRTYLKSLPAGMPPAAGTTDHIGTVGGSQIAQGPSTGPAVRSGVETERPGTSVGTSTMGTSTPVLGTVSTSTGTDFFDFFNRFHLASTSIATIFEGIPERLANLPWLPIIILILIALLAIYLLKNGSDHDDNLPTGGIPSSQVTNGTTPSAPQQAPRSNSVMPPIILPGEKNEDERNS